MSTNKELNQLEKNIAQSFDSLQKYISDNYVQKEEFNKIKMYFCMILTALLIILLGIIILIYVGNI